MWWTPQKISARETRRMGQGYPEIRVPSDLHARDLRRGYADHGERLAIEYDCLTRQGCGAKSIAPQRLRDDDHRGSTRHVIGVAQPASSSEWNSKRDKEIARHHLALDECRTSEPAIDEPTWLYATRLSTRVARRRSSS